MSAGRASFLLSNHSHARQLPGASTWETVSLLTPQLEEKMTRVPDLSNVTRFEVIDEQGRIYVRGPAVEPYPGHRPHAPEISVDLHIQDEGRTLKVFVKSR
mgnify:CR=1 FL=1